jgi:hypothetical protein
LKIYEHLLIARVNHNVETSTTYSSAGGQQTLPATTAGRTLFPASEVPGMPPTHQSPDGDVHILIKPTTEAGSVQVAAHEAYGHAVLGERKRTGGNANPFHDFDEVTGAEKNNDFKTQSYPAVSEGKRNYATNSTNKKWLKQLARQVKRLERKLD